MRQLVLILLAVVSHLNAIQANDFNTTLSSPNEKLKCEIQYLNDILAGIITIDGIESDVVKMSFGLETAKKDLGTIDDEFIEECPRTYDGVITSNISEKKLIVDKYSENTLKFRTSNNIDFEVVIRLYDEGIAVKYNVYSESGVKINNDNTAIDLSPFSPTCYTESNTESGYVAKSPSSSGSSIAPLFIQSDNLCVLMNEAGNLAYAAPLNINFDKAKYYFSQSYTNATSISTSWRYCIFAQNPVDMIDGKYIITSLNDDNTDDTDWIKPGKTIRASIPGNVFPTDSVKYRIDFAQKMNFSYVLLDAGWYGLGYSNEKNRLSDPRVPIDGLRIKEVCSYAADNGIGIILYVNKVAWDNYDNNEMLDLYKSWGASGVKLGFMDGRSKAGLQKIYSIIRGAYERQMIVNVHDNVRQTGLERKFPNLMTTEGIRGNEYRDNDGSHTTLLPFSRFMSGSADYTICYRGYPVNTNAYRDMPMTKAHQLALATAFFCPIQHIFWYGKPYEYPKEIEIEYFKELPTVWDDYKVLEGEPSQYFSIARQSGERWFVSTHCYQAREAILDLSFLDGETTYTATIYEDLEPATIQKNIIENLTADDVLTLQTAKNGGAVAIIQPSETQENNDDPDNPTQIKLSQSDNSTSDGSMVYTSDNVIKTTSGNGQMTVYDIFGRKIKTAKSDGTIDVSDLYSGIYIISDGVKSVKYIKR
ncbi:MAG: glycoside hydrolase family 97 catalytic domain-containing protein [Bacteroidales bacterium]|nr:glycoside hydrolase family 97 catalytic domain-containing protein [Bacteroidales bacterium]